jgi:hypothetical protein
MLAPRSREKMLRFETHAITEQDWLRTKYTTEAFFVSANGGRAQKGKFSLVLNYSMV